MKVIVTYNEPLPAQSEAHICHADVLDEVNHVTTALRALGYSYSTMSIGRDVRSELVELAYAGTDCVFNLCESILEQSRLQPCFTGYLELLGIPFTGAGSCGLHNAMDKQVAKALLMKAGIPTPQAWNGADLLATMRSSKVDVSAHIPLPLILKPAQEDGSIGISQASIATTTTALEASLETVVGRYGNDGVLVEQYIKGPEFCIGFLGNENPQAFPLIEYSFDDLPDSHHSIRSYESKWVADSVEKTHIRRLYPARISSHNAAAITAAGRRVWQTMHLSGYGRIDVRLDVETNEFFVIDVNANPGIRTIGDYAYGASHAGLTYPELIDRILAAAIERAAATTMPKFPDTMLAQAE
jgi:D-alanine-D-alanine ligase